MALTTKRPENSYDKLERLKALELKRAENRRKLMNKPDDSDDIEYRNVLTETLSSIEDECADDSLPRQIRDRMFGLRSKRVVAMDRLTTANKLMNDGVIKLTNDFIYDIVYKSYWVDDNVKSNMNDELRNSYDTVVSNISKVFNKNINDTKLIENVNEIIYEMAAKATDRIMKDAELNHDYDVEFELNSDEERQLNDKLSDLGTDQIVQLVKDKVLTVVQDEKKAGTEKKELMDNIKNSKDEVNVTDTDSDTQPELQTTESYIYEAVDYEQDKNKFEVIFRRGCEAVSSKKYDDAIPDLKRSLHLVERVEKSINDKDISDMNQANRCMQFYNSIQSIAPSNFRRKMPTYSTSDFLRKEDNVYDDVLKKSKDLIQELIKYCENEGEYSPKEKASRGINPDDTITKKDIKEDIAEEGVVSDFVDKHINNPLNEIKRQLTKLGNRIQDGDLAGIEGQVTYQRRLWISEMTHTESPALVKFYISLMRKHTEFYKKELSKMEERKTSHYYTEYKKIITEHVKWMEKTAKPFAERRLRELEKKKADKERAKESARRKAEDELSGKSNNTGVKESFSDYNVFDQARIRKLNNTNGSSLFECLLIESMKTIYKSSNEDAMMESKLSGKDANATIDIKSAIKRIDDTIKQKTPFRECNKMRMDTIRQVNTCTSYEGLSYAEKTIASNIDEYEVDLKMPSGKGNLKTPQERRETSRHVGWLKSTLLPKIKSKLQKLKGNNSNNNKSGNEDKNKATTQESTWYNQYNHLNEDVMEAALYDDNDIVMETLRQEIVKLGTIIKHKYNEYDKKTAERITEETIESHEESKDIILNQIDDCDSVHDIKRLINRLNKQYPDYMHSSFQELKNDNNWYRMTDYMVSYGKWLKNTALPKANKKLEELQKSKHTMQEAALYDALFTYTVMETLNTLKIYDFPYDKVKQYSRQIAFHK